MVRWWVSEAESGPGAPHTELEARETEELGQPRLLCTPVLLPEPQVSAAPPGAEDTAWLLPMLEAGAGPEL